MPRKYSQIWQRIFFQLGKNSSFALKGASINAQLAFDKLYGTEFAHIPISERQALAMAAIIHCDVCRLVTALDECRYEGLARILWMAEISSKLCEAKDWYFKIGSKLLCDIAISKSYKLEMVTSKIKKIKLTHPIVGIDNYRVYRNKFSYHYDQEALVHLIKFGKEDADSFFDLLMTFALFSKEWAALTRAIILNHVIT